jgi:hypothetical protein
MAVAYAAPPVAEARRIRFEAGQAAATIEDREMRDLALSVVAGWQADATVVSATLKTVADMDDADTAKSTPRT